ncbi:serine hydrolase [Flavobacterium sp. KDG-16]|uniref:Serine hydrolase n=2 Tax=Flavobacterium difficile TaxID=2709659 RepID=A0ABX0I2V2_9FLAO|nr:serine hydrolase [Flavobacterium difficile]
MYFPSNTDTNWETKSVSSLGWNQSQIQPLKDFLIDKHTKSFMILVNGRIVMEEYFNGHTPNATWQWNSAGKTLVATMTGIAQQENLLSINNKVSDYLGNGWTSEPLAKENLITSRNLLTMTSGLNDNSELVLTSNLTYLADAGTRWSYHNVFQKLMDVVGAASNQNFEAYFNAKLKNKIGMDGFWNNGLIYKIYHSNTRSMARFGLLALNKGKWKNEQIINETFFNESINTSQNINPSYGYLWWLNGKNSYMVPGEQTVFNGSLVSSAPAEMYAAMGAEDQRIYVIPSKKMVIIRMGDASDPLNPSFAVSGFDNALWQKINAVIN